MGNEQHKARKAITGLIASGGYSIGDRIPSVNRLSRDLGIGRISVQQAVKALHRDGVLENIPRSGCYVRNVPRTADNAAKKPGLAHGTGFAFAGGLRRRIRVGILADFSLFAYQWKKVFLDYMRAHPDLDIEAVPLTDIYAEGAFDGLDIFQAPLSFVGDLAEQGRLYSLDELGGCALDRGDIYGGLLSGVTHGRKLWGVPLISAVSCIFFNRNYSEFAGSLDFGHGFWAFMESIRTGAEKAAGAPPCAATFDIGFGEILKMASCRCGSAEMTSPKSPKMRACLSRFEKYFQDPKVAAPFLLPGHSVTETSIGNFMSGNCALMLSGSHNIPILIGQAPFQVGLLPLPLEKGGACTVAANVNVISSSSRLPMECAEILNHLASPAMQEYFASEGRLTASRKANRSLRIKDMSPASLASLAASMERGTCGSENDLPFVEFTHAVIFHEMEKWRQGQFKAAEFMDRISKRAFYFFRNGNARNNAAAAPESLKVV